MLKWMAVLMLLGTTAMADTTAAPALSATAQSVSGTAQGLTVPAGILYTVAPESRARFIVRARSFGFPETVHGREGLVSGKIYVSEGLSATARGELDIDAASLKSGIGMRDGKVHSTLKAKEHPTIVFTLDATDAFTAADLDAAGVTVTAHGRLNVAGVEVPLDFPVYARREGGTSLFVDGMGKTSFKDLKLDVPGLAFFVMLQDAIEAGAKIKADRQH